MSKFANSMAFLAISLLCLSRHCLASSISYIPSSGTQPYVIAPSGKITPLYTQSAALIISASQYAAGTSGWQKLPATKKEMDAISEALSKQGFEITRIHDPTRETIIEETQKFLGKYGSNKDARLLFYYSGHGYTDNANEMGYIVPINAKNPNTEYPKFIAQAISLESFTSWVKQFKAKHFLAVFDSCFSGAIFTSKSSSRIPQVRPIELEGRWRYLKSAAEKSARQFISAGSSNEELPAVSTFTRLFIQGIQGDASSTNDGYVTGKELGLYLEQNVSALRAGKQNPISGLPAELNSSAGDFIFQFRIEESPSIEKFNQEVIPEDQKGVDQKELPTQREASSKLDSQKRDYNLSLVLASTIGKYLSDHEQTIRTLLPLVPADLTGDEVAKILGLTSLSYRQTSLQIILPKIPLRSLSGNSIVRILSKEALSYRVDLIRTLEPHIAPEISEEEANEILGSLSYSNRSDALKIIASLIKKPLSIKGISTLLNGTYDSDKPQLVLLLSSQG